MKHKSAVTFIAGSLLAGVVLSTTAQADITVISFGGAVQKGQAKAYYGPFTASTGIGILPGEYNGEQAKIKAMVDTANVTWDVVEVESAELARGCDEGLFEKLDFKRIGDEGDFVPEAISECGVGTFLWSTVLAYDADKLATPPSSWADFWDIKKYPGKRGLRKGAKFTLEIALLADGVTPDKVYQTLSTKEGVERAFHKLDEIKPYIQWWEAGAQPPQMLAAGDLVMSSAYNGRIATARKEGKNLRIAWHNSIFDFDHWVIPLGSPHTEEAYQFIAFASRPENQKVFSSEISYGSTNVKAVAMLDQEIVSELPSAPEYLKSALASNTRFWVEHGEDLEQRFNSWAAK